MSADGGDCGHGDKKEGGTGQDAGGGERERVTPRAMGGMPPPLVTPTIMAAAV
jgi:hypothetical protein